MLTPEMTPFPTVNGSTHVPAGPVATRHVVIVQKIRKHIYVLPVSRSDILLSHNYTAICCVCASDFLLNAKGMSW